MKCNHCKAEWTAHNSNKTTCPFCDRPLVEEIKLEGLLPPDILKHIFTKYGEATFTDSVKLSGMLADMLVNDPKILKLYCLAVREQIPNKLLVSKHLDASGKELKIRSLKVSFEEDNYLKDSVADYVIDSFAYALGWVDVADVAELVRQANVFYEKKQYSEAMPLYQKAADQGCADGQFGLSRCYYYYGNGVTRDYEQAVYWIQKAADQGNANAQNGLGICYYKGEGAAQDYKQAVYWYQKAADQGNTNAQDSLGICYYKGEGAAQDYKQAVYWIQKAANQGNAYAQNSLGVCFKYGNGVTKDYKQAVYWFQKAAEQGNATAQNSLGNRYYYGQGVTEDYKQAVYWFQKAADQGNADAQYSLGYCYYYGQGVTQEYKQAVYWYQKAADQGNADAQNNLGDCYYNGEGVTEDYKQAVYWYQKAADQGNADAQYMVGNQYYYRDNDADKDIDNDEGDGRIYDASEFYDLFLRENNNEEYENDDEISENYIQAVCWYQKAAEQGHVAAQNMLGHCYYYYLIHGNYRDYYIDLEGDYYEEVGVKDYKKAVYWFQKAADQGDADAQNNLGNCLYNGKGIQKDYEDAVYWFQKAADQGNADAQNNLGKCYQYGNGVIKDCEKAVYWYKKAADQNHPEAQFNLGYYYYSFKIKQHYEKAVYWCKKAREQDHPDAEHVLNDLRERMEIE